MGDRSVTEPTMLFGSTPPPSGTSQNLYPRPADSIVPEQQTTAADDTSLVPLPSILLSPSAGGDFDFTGVARIRIQLADVHSPVLVWTSLNSWQAPLEMAVDGRAPNTYSCEVDNVPEQPFQYKVRIGTRWVLGDNMPIAQDQAGNHNNVGYAERIPREGTLSGEMPTMANQNVPPMLANIPPLDSGHAQTDTGPTTGEAVVPPGVPDANEDLDVDPSYDVDQEAPLLRHETFQETDSARPRTEDEIGRGPQPMSTIQEETATTSDNDGIDSQPQTPSSLEQAREYQRALIEAMPTSIADGFTRASVLLPVRAPDAASEFDNAPLMRHETVLSPGSRRQVEQQDELSHAPLMRHESGLGNDDARHEDPDERPEAADDSAEHRVSYGTTLVGEENDADDEFSHAPLMRHETAPGRFDDSEHSSLFSERMMFPMETSNPPTLVGPHRASSVYSRYINELDRAPTLPHEEMPDWWVSDESAFDDYIDPRARPDYNRGNSYYEAETDSSDELSVGELDRAPTMPHEVGGETVGELDRAPTLLHETENGASSNGSGTDELDIAPMLPHEDQSSSDTKPITGSDGASSDLPHTSTRYSDAASQRSNARRIISGEDGLLPTSKTNSFTSDRLREAFENRIFGATRQTIQDEPGESEFDFGGAPLLAHERAVPLPGRSSSGSRNGSWRQRTIEIPEFPSFAGRTSTGTFRSQRSNLPHRMPRSDEEDLDLRDPSLEVFPMDRDQVFGRVRDITNRLAEDQVRSPVVDLDSPAVVSYTSSSVNLAPIRTSSTMSLHSIREDASENEDELRLPSPVLMLASRVPKSSPINVQRASARQHAGIIHEEMEVPEADNSKRHGKIFDTVALPPKPPQANIALPPKPVTVSFQEPYDTNTNGKAKKRSRTPYPEGTSSDEEEFESGSIAHKFCARFGACFQSRHAR